MHGKDDYIEPGPWNHTSKYSSGWFADRATDLNLRRCRIAWVIQIDNTEAKLAKWSDICEQAAEQGAFIGRCREYANARERRN